MKINNIYLTLVLTCVPLMSQGSITESSMNYVESYLGYLNSTSEKETGLASAKKKLNSAKKAVSSNTQQQKNTNSSIHKQRGLKKSLPNQIAWSKNKIKTNKQEIQKLMLAYFPGVTNISQINESLQREKQQVSNQLTTQKELLQREKENFNSSTFHLQQSITEKQNQLTKITTKVKSLRKENREVKQQNTGKKQEIDKVQKLMNNPQALQNKLKEARRKFNVADQNRKNKGKSCGGLSTITSSTCRKWARAKNQLKNIRSIKNGSKLRKLKAEYEKSMRVVRRNKRKIERLVTERRGIKRDLREDQRDLDSFTYTYNSSVNQIEAKISNLNHSLNTINRKSVPANKVVSLQKDTAGHQRALNKYESDLRLIDSKISQLKVKLSNLKNKTTSLKRKKEEAQFAYNDEVVKFSALKKSVSSNRLNLENDLAEGNLVLTGVETDPILEEEVLLESKKWTTSLSSTSVFDLKSCSASTSEISEEGALKLTLSVVKVTNATSSGYTEPVVIVTVSTQSPDDYDLRNYHQLETQISSINHKFTLLPSLSTSSKRVFISKLEDRAKIINLLIRKNTVQAKFSNEETQEETLFSLSGSGKAIKNSRKSLAKQCGGINIL